MAYTGKNLYDDLAIRVYQGGAGAFLNTNRAQYVVRFAIKEALEKRYNSIIKQQSTDEINKLVKVDKYFPVINNKVLLKPLDIVNVEVAQTNVSFRITFNRIPNLNFDAYFDAVPIYISGIIGTDDIAALNNNSWTAAPDTINNDPYSILVSYPSTTGTYTSGGQVIPDVNNYSISLDDSLWIYDYYHLLSVALTGYVKVKTTIKSFDTAKQRGLFSANNVRTGERIRVTLPGTDCNQNVGYVKMIGLNLFELYTDELLMEKMVITGTYTTNGTIYRYMERYAEPAPSDMKISPYEATEYFPLYQTAENELSLTPQIFAKAYYKADYISSASDIDVTNTITDLLQVYNLSIIDEIIERAAVKFFALTSSQADVQITTAINQGQ